MRKISAIAAKGHLIRYGGELRQTETMKILLCFYGGSEAWKGMFPGADFDHYYDDIMFQLGPEQIDPNILIERRTYPTMIYPAKEIGVCHREICSKATEFKYCSLHCWYTNSLDHNQYTIDNADTVDERNAAIVFRGKLVKQFGKAAEGSKPRVSEEDGLLIV